MRISDWSSDVCSSDLPCYLAKHPIKRNRREAERKHSGRHQSHEDRAGAYFLHQRRHQRPPIFARAIRKKRMANATSNNPVTRKRDYWHAMIWSCYSTFMLKHSGRTIKQRKAARNTEG